MYLHLGAYGLGEKEMETGKQVCLRVQDSDRRDNFTFISQ